MTVDIYIREKSGDREIRIPLLPEEIKSPNGEVIFIKSDIMGRGEVAIPAGTELRRYTWESEFPGELRKHDAMIRGAWQDPKNYRNLLEEWASKGTELNLLVTGYPINVDVYCMTFEPVLTGAFGDIAYEVTFIEARSITITTSKVETTSTQRPTSTSGSYTIKSGDTLWEIAVQFYGTGTKWQLIYDANKAIIESAAKDHGRSSSQNGHWIYPGVTLNIPQANGTTASTSGTIKNTSSSGSSGNSKTGSSKAGSSTGSTTNNSNNNKNKTPTQQQEDLISKGRDAVTAASEAVKKATAAASKAFTTNRNYQLVQSAVSTIAKPKY